MDNRAATQPKPLAQMRRERAQIDYQIANSEGERADQQAAREDKHLRWLSATINEWEGEHAKALADYEGYCAALAAHLPAHANLSVQVQNAKVAVEEARSMVLLNGSVEGKNAEQRQAQLAMALKQDADYQVFLDDLRHVENDLDHANAEIEVTRRRLDGCKAAMRFCAAKLEALAG